MKNKKGFILFISILLIFILSSQNESNANEKNDQDFILKSKEAKK